MLLAMQGPGAEGSGQLDVELPPELVDEAGRPARGNQNERIVVTRASYLPDVEVWRAERSARHWRVYHEDYSFCTVDDGWRGEARWRYRGRELEMSPTALQVFEPGLAHHTFHVREPAANFHVLVIRKDHMAALLGREPPHLRPFTDNRALQLALRRACRAIRFGRDPLSAKVALVDYAQALFRIVGELPSKPDSLKVRDWRFRRVHEMIHDGFHGDLSVEALASNVGLSPERLVNLFRQCSSLPVHQYLIALRLAKARRLLIRGVKPSEAALQSGFYDLRHFGRVMKQHFGFTPSHYFKAPRSESLAESGEGVAEVHPVQETADLKAERARA